MSIKTSYLPQAALLLLIGLCYSCTWMHRYRPCDRQATAETRALYSSMARLVDTGILFGHHDDTGYGVHWKYDEDSSDVKNVCGSYPAVYGWDLAKIEHDSTCDINGLPFSLQRQRVKEAFERGGINTFSWHIDNPADGKTAWDTSMRTARQLIPGGAFNAVYRRYLDRAARYLASLKGRNGEPVPVLFRPFHEMTGNWFWWGKNTCTPHEFKTLWRYTVDYLRKTKKLHNLLIVYSAADFDSEADFMTRYPGDNYVDFVGFDNYCVGSVTAYAQKLDKQLALLDEVAAKHHKLPCLAETGYLNIPQADWWTKVLLPVISKCRLSYALVWRNADTSQYYAPYPGQASAADFKKFAASREMIFQDRLTPQEVYGKPLP